jgi:diadenosine tetraphosphatase ApaH/serine/threonine PP2A family protein phosphatase
VPEAWEFDNKRVRWAEREGDELPLIEGLQYAINVGSVGQPRDGDSRACYAIYNSQARVVWWRRIPYDIAATERAMASLGMSTFAATRLHVGM